MYCYKSVWFGLAFLVLPLLGAAEEVNQEFEVTPGQSLSLALDRVGGRIDIAAWEQNRVRIQGRTRGWRDGSRLELHQSATGIDVAPQGRPDDDAEVELSIQVPRQFDVDLEAQARTSIQGVHGRIEVSLGNASLDLDDVHGEARINTANGKLRLRNCSLSGKISNVNGQLRIEDSDLAGEASVVNSSMWLSRAPKDLEVTSTNGNIEIEHAADAVLARTTNGSVEIAALEGPIEAETVNGHVRVALRGDPGGDHAVDIETLNGGVEVEIPAEFSLDFDVEVRSEDGDRRDYEIVSDFDLDIQTHNTRRVHRVEGKGNLGDGRNSVRIRATNGDVRLLRAPAAR